MSSEARPPETGQPHLHRQFNLLQATALNMANMVGAGPFITIPILMTFMGGPQALLGWLVAILITIPDGMIWSELGAAMPGSAVIFTGVTHFDPARAFNFPPGAFQLSTGFFLGLAAASRIGIYDYLGYYDICYIGDEVRNPGRVIPRSIILSLLCVAAIYLMINLSIIGVVPWQEFVPAAERKPVSDFVVSIFMERVWGPQVAAVFTAMILWTTFGSVFALLLGYSRIPYAAAQDGGFFPVFGRLHPTKDFPYVSLLLIGGIAIVCSFFPLDAVIGALLTTRILVQFIGQVAAVVLLRRLRPDMPRPYRIWLYPLPVLIALAGWIFLFVTSDPQAILFGLVSLVAGIGCYFAWAWRFGHWPFSQLKVEG